MGPAQAGQSRRVGGAGRLGKQRICRQQGPADADGDTIEEITPGYPRRRVWFEGFHRPKIVSLTCVTISFPRATAGTAAALVTGPSRPKAGQSAREDSTCHY